MPLHPIHTWLALTLLLAVNSAAAAPPLTVENINLAAPKLKIWNVKATSAVREGSSTANESGQITLKHRDGGQSTHDATLRVQSSTLFQDGEICHNYGKQCYCGTTTYRLETGLQKWKFAIPSNNQPVACPEGVQPTGDADIKKSMSKEEIRALAEAKRRQLQEERAAKRAQELPK
jgi:hypothetical protein